MSILTRNCQKCCQRRLVALFILLSMALSVLTARKMWGVHSDSSRDTA